MADEERQQQSDVYKRRRGYASDAVGSVILLAFCAAGLGTTLNGKYRGDYNLFVVAFAFGIAYSSFEILISIAGCVLESFTEFCTKFPASRTAYAKSGFYAVCSIIAFALLVAALATSAKESTDHWPWAGCANNFGCANIMAIIACIGYGGRVLQIAFGVLCIFCATCCVTCCACLACCVAASAENTENSNNNNRSERAATAAATSSGGSSNAAYTISQHDPIPVSEHHIELSVKNSAEESSQPV